MILLGITGPIGHGKSTLAGCLVSLEATARQDESSRVIASVVERLNKYLVGTTVPSPTDLPAVNKWLAHLAPILNDVCQVACSPKDFELTPSPIASDPEEYQKLWQYLESLRDQPEYLEQPISQANKEFFRPMLQWLGGYAVNKIHPGIWYAELVRRAKHAELEGCELFVVAGVRYPLEADLIRNAGGTVVKVERPTLGQKDSTDPTERQRDSVRADATVVNAGTLEDLQLCAAQLLRDIYNSQLQPVYRCD